jgi:hypothetical protein
MPPESYPSYHFAQEIETYKHNLRKYHRNLFLFYGIILVCWLAVTAFTFLFQNIIKDSPSVAAYLTEGKLINGLDYKTSAYSQGLDLVLKGNFILYNGIVGFGFLIFMIMPKLKQKNVYLLVLFLILGFVTPLIFAGLNLLLNGINTPVTFNSLILSFISSPLNWSVFLFLYYILEEVYLHEA